MGCKFLYIDETAVDENLYPIYGYSKKNHPYIVVTTSTKTERIFLLMCIAEDKIIDY
jgi:hypothetical protein